MLILLTRWLTLPASQPATAAPMGSGPHFASGTPPLRRPTRSQDRSRRPSFTLQNRGARMRTGDPTDPNGARYQAAPRPDAVGVFHTPTGPPSASDARPYHRNPRGARSSAGLRALPGLRPQRSAGRRAERDQRGRERRIGARGAVRAGGR